MEKIISPLTTNHIRAATLSFLASRIDNQVVAGQTAMRREPAQILRSENSAELAERIRHMAQRMREQYPPFIAQLKGVETLIQKILDTESEVAALQCLQDVQKSFGSPAPSTKEENRPTYFTLETEGNVPAELSRKDHTYSANLQDALTSGIEKLKFVAAVMEMCADYRSRGKAAGKLIPLTEADELALEYACRLVESGVRLPHSIEPLRKSRERKHQTYLSFADPGDGHLKVTVRDSTLLDGTILHVEWIDRDSVDRKDLVEAYRLSSPGRAARVRLLVGNETPCTAFIGRPVYESKAPGVAMTESEFEMALLKAVHMTASACSAMFAHGIVDCKIAMDGMTAKQAVTFMRHVAGNVVRDPYTQWLSAAFNLNTPLVDDLKGDLRKRTLTGRYEIAEFGIDLVKLGSFDKIAWDGASDQQPSKSIIGQLTRPELLTLVHQAHARNLESYISAGMLSRHMQDAVYLGIGGVGIGTSLHYIVDKATKQIGEIDPQLVRDALAIRNRAANDDAGKAARKLAELDWRFSEGSLTGPLDVLRQELFNALLAFNQAFDAVNRPIDELAPRKSKGTLTPAEEKDLDRAYADREAFKLEVPALQALLEKIAEAEFDSSPTERGSTRGPTFSTALAHHPLIERAERVIAAHRGGRATVGPIRIDGPQLRKLERAFDDLDPDLIQQVFLDVDKTVDGELS